jgi:hypothetical protein
MRRAVAHRILWGGWLWVLPLVASIAPASAAPARLRVTVTGPGIAETRVVERTAPRAGEAASLTEKFELAGSGWSVQGVVGGSDGSADVRGPVPRGGTIMFTAKVGLASGFVNSTAGPLDVEMEVCVQPFVAGAGALYGGSIAGTLLDADGDGTGSVTTNPAQDPIYLLRTSTATCPDVNPGSTNTVDTLYDHPQTFNVPGVFQGAAIAEQFFGGDPIPIGLGPVTGTSFEMLIRYRATPGEFVGITSMGILRGETSSAAVGPTATPGPGSQLTAAPARRAEPVVIAALQPRGVPTPGPALGPLFRLGIAAGHSTRPTPTPSAFNDNSTAAVNPPIESPSKHGGIVLGSMTDFSGTNCTVQTVDPLPLYRASVDGVVQFSLYDHPNFFIANNYHSVLIGAQTFGAPIPSAAGPAVANNLRLDLDAELLNPCLASFLALYVVPGCADPSYDVDKNATVNALTDGLIILRYLFGFTGSTLTAGALGPGATRTDPAAIVAYLNCLATTMLDVDANNALGSLSDGLLILRFLFGFSGTTLTTGAIGQNATRTDPAAIAAFMSQFNP